MHYMLHGLGGFLGGLIGILLLRPVNEPCDMPILGNSQPCQDALGFSGAFVDAAGWEWKVTVLALLGIGIGELLKRSE